MDDIPYKDLKKPTLPTQHMFKQEVVRRLPQYKIRKLKNLELISLLQLEEYKVTDKADCNYIIESEKVYRSFLLEKEEEQKKDIAAQRGPSITFGRYILCACLGVVEGFSMDDSPYKDLKKPMLLTQHMFKQ